MEVRPGYKVTEVGVIPEDWDARNLLDLAERKKELFDDGDWVEAEFLTDRGIRLIQTGNIGEGEFTDKAVKKYISSESFKKLRCKALQVGDILICRLAEPAGRACVLRDIGEDRMITAVDVTIFRPPAAMADRHFLVSLFTTPRWYQTVAERCGGSTRTRISRGELGKIFVPLPTLSEQRAIAAALSDVDALLGGLDRLIAKKRDLKQAAMQQLLTGKTRLPGFHGEWEVKAFGEVLVRLNAKAYQVQTSDYQATGKYPVVDQGKEQVIGFSDIEEKCLRCPDGGVVVFGDHTCFVKFIDFDFLVGADGTQILLGKAGQNTRFHAFQLQYRGVKPTGYNRHFKFLKERAFVVPPLPEQTSIAAVLSDMDAGIEALEARRNKTRDLKQAMMQELLTGRTRLV